jgi:adenylate cyclase
VNIAARLESANKQLGTRICVSQSVVDEIDGFEGRPVGTLMLKGKSQALRAYEPLSTQRFASPATAAYLEAFSKVEAGDPAARQAFAALVGQHDDDPLANFHLGRLLRGEVGADIDLG